ncbi:MAG TPA: hypothetical protein VNO70_12615, partial [Blastocatellia bacterium]|nr:hypothetical protein [Blastocatellia bacterium]
MMKPSKPRFQAFALLAVTLFFAVTAHAQSAPDASQLYEKTEAMVAMRDGVRLNTHIYAPKSASGPLPFLL